MASGTVTLRAYASASGMVDSSVATGFYTISSGGGGRDADYDVHVRLAEQPDRSVDDAFGRYADAEFRL